MLFKGTTSYYDLHENITSFNEISHTSWQSLRFYRKNNMESLNFHHWIMFLQAADVNSVYHSYFVQNYGDIAILPMFSYLLRMPFLIWTLKVPVLIGLYIVFNSKNEDILLMTLVGVTLQNCMEVTIICLHRWLSHIGRTVTTDVILLININFLHTKF